MIEDPVIGRVYYTWLTNLDFFGIFKIKLGDKFDKKVNPNLYQASIIDQIMKTKPEHWDKLSVRPRDLFNTFEDILEDLEYNEGYDERDLIWAIFSGKHAADTRKIVKDDLPK